MNEYQNTASTSSGLVQHTIDMWLTVYLGVCVCVRELQHIISRGVWLSWRWEGCVVAMAVWSSSTGNASKR